MLSMADHGPSKYANEKCRCNICKESWAVYHKSLMDKHPEWQENHRNRSKERYRKQQEALGRQVRKRVIFGSVEWYCKRQLTKIKSDAKKRNILFDLDVDILINQYHKQNGTCYYTGRPLIFEIRGREISPSVDRKDSQLGYTKNNIVWCSSIVNICKNTLNDTDFIILCKEVAAYS